MNLNIKRLMSHQTELTKANINGYQVHIIFPYQNIVENYFNIQVFIKVSSLRGKHQSI